MRKRKVFRQLGKDSAHRWVCSCTVDEMYKNKYVYSIILFLFFVQAMLRNMVTSLIHHERIMTTTPKAKELRRVAEQCVTYAKKGFTTVC